MNQFTPFQALILLVGACIVMLVVLGVGLGAFLAQRRGNQVFDEAVLCAGRHPLASGDLAADIGLFCDINDRVAVARRLEELARVLAALAVALLVMALAAGGSVAWVH